MTAIDSPMGAATSKQPAPAGVTAAKSIAIENLDVQLSLLWRRARGINHQLSRSVHPDLEPAAYGLLSVLLHEGDMRLTDLARRIGVGKPSISRQISFLVSIGLARKTTDPSDGRAQLIALTPAGITKMRSTLSGRQAAFHERLANWDDLELETLTALLEKLNED